MSLVCYGSSDSEEESEEIKSTSESDKLSLQSSEEKNISKYEEQNFNKAGERNIPNFDSIPKPAAKKGRETVKITIPSLDQFKDEDIKIESKAKPAFKGGSGLLSMLPPPKYSSSVTQRGLTPYILTKQKNAEKKTPEIKPVPKKSSSSGSINRVSVSKAEHSSENISTNNDEDGDDSATFDFFSLESANKKTEIEENNVLNTQLPNKSSLFSSLPEPTQSASHTITPIYQEEAASGPFTSYSSSQSENYSGNYEWNENVQTAYTSDQTGWSVNYQSVQDVDQTDVETQFLKDESFKKMLGRKKEEVQIIDVNADDQLTGKEQWLMQSLTEEKIHRPSKRKGEMPTQQQKRKHQITYLAFQAKERELDLKNQWSLNRSTRRETQAKYGF
ncbi:proline-rich protein PRCC-like [Argiope bruennichi]|uniref:Proline-rich protein PRCC like protein n=1 Tax=Argiope bruennichi TaxID=94029 RepID=A0A8T0G1H2_ARGBR|nr:proline-rich protein PRCC-like [Argiope bruennichi]KAF8795023.1 Proline-rich protein PRCC like protein [Argiope bruennichi]